MADKIKVLLLHPGSLGLVYIRFDDEVREIENKIQLGPFRDSFVLIPRSGIRIDDLGTLLLRHRPHVFHLSGHSEPSKGILLEDVDGYAKRLEEKALASILRPFNDSVRIVFLNVCYSRPYAEAIAQDINYIIGMNGAIEEEAAIVFAGSFYEALACGRSVKEAFEIAKEQLNIKSLEGSEVPMLLTSPQVRDFEPFTSQDEFRGGTRTLKPIEYKEKLKIIQRLIDEVDVELTKDATQRTTAQSEEIWRWQSEDGIFVAYAIMEMNGDLAIHLRSSDTRLEGARLRFRLGALSQDITMQRICESEIGAKVEVIRPRSLADISIELI